MEVGRDGQREDLMNSWLMVEKIDWPAAGQLRMTAGCRSANPLYFPLLFFLGPSLCQFLWKCWPTNLLLFIILLFSSCSYFISLFDIIASYFSTSPFSICRISFLPFITFSYVFFPTVIISLNSLQYLLLFVPISSFLLLLSLSFPFSSSSYFSVFALIYF